MMKLTCRNYMITLLILPFSLLSQTNDRFVAEAFENNDFERELEAYFTDFSMIHLPAEEIEAFLQSPEPVHQMLWALPNGQNWEMTLEPAPILGGTFNLKIQGENKQRILPIDTDEVHTFRAQNSSDEHRLTVNGNFIYGYTIQDNQEWYIEPVSRFIPDAEAQIYIIYQNRHVRPIPNLKCGATDRYSAPDIEPKGRETRNTCYELELAIAADYSMYAHYGSVLDAFAQIEGVMNNVCGNFDTEFAEEIDFRISEMIVSSCESCDPWTNSPDAAELINSFRDWAFSETGMTNDFDLAQFWTRRPLENDGDGNVVGLAYVGVLCTDNRFHVLEDFTASASYLRVMTAHEIGHNFGCVHNFNTSQYSCFNAGRPDHIMDPAVTNTSLWADGITSLCTVNSILRIETALANSNCISATCTDYCAPLYDLQAQVDIYSPTIDLSWNAEGLQEFRIRLRNINTNTYTEFFTESDNIHLDSTDVELCTNYEVLIDRICGEQYGKVSRLMINTEAESIIRVTNLQTRNCQIETNTYDLDLYIEYDEAFSEGFSIQVGDQVFQKNYSTSPQFIKIEGLTGTGDEEMFVTIKSNTHTSNNCAAILTYRVPDRTCSYKTTANFDDNRLPLGWRLANNYIESTDWQISDSTRLVVNFQAPDNQTTINGTKMAYFDDDILGPGDEFEGTASMTTATMDLENYEDISFSLNYNFNTYFSNPHTAFIIDVFDGQQWVNILTDHDGSGCLPNNAWAEQCNTFFEANLTPYANGLLQLRFSYSDGGRWGEFIAIDDFELNAVKDLSVLPVELSHFTAKAEEKNIVLDWATTQEVNNDYFEIEHAIDARHFNKIGSVNGVGNSQQLQQYTFTDYNPKNGANYYRLRQVDVDGDYKYSNIVRVNIEQEDKWRIYPNPITDGSTLNIERENSNNNHSTDFQLFNAHGQLIANYSMNRQDNHLALNLDQFSSGVYILKEVGGQSTRFVK